MMTSNAAISDSKMAMATDSDVGSTSVTIWPRQLPPHWANRISARHSSADRPSLIMFSGFRCASAGCSFLNSSKLSNTAFTTTYTMSAGTLLDDTTVDLSGKVDKVAGKGLSTNDYTTAEKTKLAGIAEGANKYVHPSHTAATSGLYKITVDALGHVIAVTKVTKEDITGLGIPGTNTTYGLASTTANGLMSKEDYAKLNGMVLATDTEVDAMLTEVFGS